MCGRNKENDGELDACCSKQRCACLPYNDGYMVAAQVISIVAFLVSWIWWVTFIIGFASMIFLQITWCCRQNKCGVFASAGVAALATISSFIAGIIMLVFWKDKTYCEVFTFNRPYYDYYQSSERDYCREGAWSIVAFVTGIMWFAVTGCILYFVGSGRHAKWEERLCNSNNSGEGGATTTATAIEMGSVLPTTTASASATIPTAGETFPPAAVAAATVYVPPEILNKVDDNDSGEGGGTTTATAIKRGAVPVTTTASVPASAAIPTAGENLSPAAVVATTVL